MDPESSSNLELPFHEYETGKARLIHMRHSMPDCWCVYWGASTSCRANTAHMRLSRPHFCLDFQVKERDQFQVVPSSLGSGTRREKARRYLDPASLHYCCLCPLPPNPQKARCGRSGCGTRRSPRPTPRYWSSRATPQLHKALRSLGKGTQREKARCNLDPESLRVHGR